MCGRDEPLGHRHVEPCQQQRPVVTDLTSSPISLVKMASASTASSIVTCSSVRASGSIVVFQSCSGFISPNPL